MAKKKTPPFISLTANGGNRSLAAAERHELVVIDDQLCLVLEDPKSKIRQVEELFTLYESEPGLGLNADWKKILPEILVLNLISLSQEKIDLSTEILSPKIEHLIMLGPFFGRLHELCDKVDDLENEIWRLQDKLNDNHHY